MGDKEGRKRTKSREKECGEEKGQNIEKRRKDKRGAKKCREEGNRREKREEL